MMRVVACLFCAVVALTSSSTASGVSFEHVWAMVKISYGPATTKAKGGSTCTVFFVNETTFVTSHHTNEVNSAKWRPDAGYSNVRVFLVNHRGDIIDDFWFVRRVPEYDLAVGRIGKPHAAVQVASLQAEIAPGEQVYNIGFPESLDAFEPLLFREGHRLIVKRIGMKPATQEGTVRFVRKITFRSLDIDLQDKTVVVLDYSSRVGFSGGPLVSRKSGKVVGLMSFVVPKGITSGSPAVAIGIADIEALLGREGQFLDAGDDD